MDKLCKALNKSSSKENIPAKHWNDYESFVELEMNLFGIDTTEEKTLYQQKSWGAKMTDLDQKIYKNKILSTLWLLFNIRRSKMRNMP